MSIKVNQGGLMADEDSGASLELDAEHKTVKITGKKTAEIIAILSLIAMMWMGWVLYTHASEAKAGVDRLGDAIERMVQGQTQATCLLGFPEAQREAKARWCEDLARQGRR